MAFAEWGFGVFSVWGITEGVCRCPKGQACTSPGKHPIPIDGLKSATSDPERVRTMLAAQGSQGQYGVVPAPHIIVLDVDGEGWKDKLRTLGLPRTFAVETANGVHLYFYWPESYGPQPTRLYDWVVRSQEHPGYVIGPGSTHQTGTAYRIAHQNGHDIFTMLGRIAVFPQEATARDAPVITVGQGLRPPESIPEGSRHDYLRDRARTLRGGGLTGDALLTAMQSINARLPSPKSDEELRRAIGDVETKFGEDPAPPDPIAEVADIPVAELFVNVADYRAANSADVEWVSPIAAYGHVSLISGPPKSGKSTLVGNLLTARETNTVFLWGQAVPTGPTALVTEEGGYPVVRKTEGLMRLDIMDRLAFISAGLRSLDHLLAAMTRWVDMQDGRCLAVIDTLAVWGDIKDENDAVAANRAVIALSVWAQHTGTAVVLVHHARKGGGEHGEAIRGSNAIFGAVAHSAELSYGTTPEGDSRRLKLSGRLDFPDSALLDFDRDLMLYTRSHDTLADDFKLEQFPMEGTSDPGLVRQDAENLWDLGERATNKRLKQLVDEKRLIRHDVRNVGDRTPHAEYKRPAPLLDLRPVGERMADIIKGTSDD
jgi:hypothetical protein